MCLGIYIYVLTFVVLYRYSQNFVISQNTENGGEGGEIEREGLAVLEGFVIHDTDTGACGGTIWCATCQSDGYID